MSQERSCRSCMSFQSAKFHLLSPEVLKKFEEFKSAKRFMRGEQIFKQGDQIQSVLCLRHGLVKLEMNGQDGATITAGYLRGGDLLGLGPIISCASSNVSAIAVEETQACAFRSDMFLEMLRINPEVAMVYMKDLFEDLRQTQQRLLSGNEKDVHARVAEAVLYLKANFDPHRFTRKEIAEWAGTTTESVIRTLGDFEAEGILEQVGREIIIKNVNALKEKAGLIF